MGYPNPFPLFIPALMWLAVGGAYVAYLKNRMFGQFVREEGPQGHRKKAGTPTAGGVLIVLTVLVALLGFVIFDPRLLSPQLLWAVAILLVFGAMGFSDDYLKVAKKNNDGISGWAKLAIQMAAGLGLGLWMMTGPGAGWLYWLGTPVFYLGWAYPLFAMLVITGASNAYNLTDGLDGLAAGSGFMTFMGFAVIMAASLASGPVLLALLLAGGCLGFLVYNKYPARIFMGDTGSLALGGVMGAFAVLSHSEFLLLLLGGLYVVETLSVMLQVTWFKLTKGKRLFKMSPLHHHFELSGWSEPHVVLTFVLFQACLSALAILLYNNSLTHP